LARFPTAVARLSSNGSARNGRAGPRAILDLGSTVGHNIVPLALAFPDTEVIAIDAAAASLRYGHARAQALGARNIRFVQMNART
jgi:tRNA G46 methylase TrmB